MYVGGEMKGVCVCVCIYIYIYIYGDYNSMNSERFYNYLCVYMIYISMGGENSGFIDLQVATTMKGKIG